MNDTSHGTRAAGRTADAPAESASRWRYRLTLLLFAIFAAAVVIWFQRHVEPFVTETLIIGGTVSAWGLWKLLWSMYEDAGGESGKDLTRKLLGGPGALPAVVFGLIVATLLHAGTSSVYLRHGGALPGEEAFKVRVMNGDRVFMGPYTVSPGTSIGGRPMFPRFRTLNLRYEIVGRTDFFPEEHALAPWSAHHLEVPGSFRRKEIHVLRLVPGWSLFGELRAPGQESGDTHYLELRAGDRSRRIEDLLQGLVVTGSAEENLPNLAALREDADLRQRVTDYFRQKEAEDLESVVSGLFGAEPQPLSFELAADDEVEIEIGVTGAAPRVLATCLLKVPASGDRHHTFIVGPEEKGCQ